MTWITLRSLPGACPTLGSTKISTHTFGLGSTILTRSICFHPNKSVIFGNVGQAPSRRKSNCTFLSKMVAPAWFGLIDFKVLLLGKPGGAPKARNAGQPEYRHTRVYSFVLFCHARSFARRISRITCAMGSQLGSYCLTTDARNASVNSVSSIVRRKLSTILASSISLSGRCIGIRSGKSIH